MTRRFWRRLHLVALALAASSGTAFAADEHAHAKDDEHVDVGHEEGHGGHGEQHFNFSYGLLGEGDADTEPSLLFRPKGMPVPFLANLINAAILFAGIYFLGKKGMVDALAKRRQKIIQGMDDAAKMKSEANQQLAMYEQKLAEIEADVERLKKEMREAAETERNNILAEARARRERMERDARLLIQQELEAAHDALRRDTVRSAVESATKLLSQRVTADDQSRLEREYLSGLPQSTVGFSRPAGERGQA
jgi:F-type H+-transporting ATPase subunit b